MKIPVWILSAVLIAAIGSQAWLISTVIDLKTDVAVIKSEIHSPKAITNITKP